MLRWFMTPACLFGSLWTADLLATTLQVKKAGTPLLKEARKDASLILELKEGQILKAETRAGMYWKVVLPDGAQGFVSVMAVQHKAQDDNGLQTALRNQALAARKDAGDDDSSRARSAVMGVRGLSESKEVGSAGQLRPDTSAVFHMEDRLIEAERIQGLENLVQEELENTLKARLLQL